MKKNFYYKMNLRRIWGLSKKIFLSNLYRNVVVIIAVVLSTFMLTSVFSVGFSYIETAQLQQIRAMGTTAHVAINNPSDLQVSEIKKSDSIKDIGISQHLGQIDGLEDEDLLLGILNFVTTMITSVNNRKQEFAILESIGMTHRQQLKILLIEGFYYWIISFILLLIVGNGIYIPLYFWFKQIVSYASFKMPYASLLIVLIIIFMVCLVTPFFAYQSILKDRLIERINKQ